MLYGNTDFRFITHSSILNSCGGGLRMAVLQVCNDILLAGALYVHLVSVLYFIQCFPNFIMCTISY